MQNKKTGLQNKYADIINLPRHISPTRPQMSVSDRAAQFSPFAALTGHDAEIKETARITDEFVELDEDNKTILNEKLQLILEKMKDHPQVTVTYFQSDSKKAGGTYISVTGCVKKIDEYEQRMVMIDGTKIPVSQIYDIDGEFFRNIEF